MKIFKKSKDEPKQISINVFGSQEGEVYIIIRIKPQLENKAHDALNCEK